MGAILAALGTVGEFLKLAGAILGLIQQERQTQVGMDLQAGHDAEVALVTVKAEEAAVASAPQTLDDAEAAMDKGTF